MYLLLGRPDRSDDWAILPVSQQKRTLALHATLYHSVSAGVVSFRHGSAWSFPKPISIALLTQGTILASRQNDVPTGLIPLRWVGKRHWIWMAALLLWGVLCTLLFEGWEFQEPFVSVVNSDETRTKFDRRNSKDEMRQERNFNWSTYTFYAEKS